ncbi:MAG: alpha/beta fold hydrolase [Bacteroidales bacterium]|nr:alpha/beta fold hydrolase [Bacteroidales bacterium]
MDTYTHYQNKKIHFTDQGEGKTIVLLHGFMESLGIWTNISNDLSKNFRIICIDLPGHGLSECIAEEHSMELMADVVKHVLNHLNVDKCVLIGHSMGGYVSLAFAAKNESMLMGLGLFHSSALPDNEETRINRDRTITLVEADKTRFIAQFIPDLFAPHNQEKYSKEISNLVKTSSQMSRESVIAALLGMKNRRGALDVLTESAFPILFIAGRHDNRIPYDKILAQSMLPQRSELSMLGDVGHMAYIEAADDSLLIIKHFAEKCFAFTS